MSCAPNHRTLASASALLLCQLAVLALASELRGQQPTLVVSDDGEAGELIVQVGPVRIPAHTAYDATVPTVEMAGEFPIDGWLRGFDVELIDSEGRSLPKGFLHHMGLFAPGERDVFSPVMRRIVAFGKETDPIHVPGPVGYPVWRGDSLLVAAAFFNPTAEAHDAVYLRLRISYMSGDHRRMAVLPLYLDVLPPGHRVFDVPPGGTVKSWDWSPAIPGRAVGLGGHLHQHGVELILEDVTRGKVLWRSKPMYDRSGELTGMTRKRFGRGIPFHPDRVYRLTAIYDNPTDEPLRGAMGKIGGAFLPAKGVWLPAADRDDPEYLRDLDAMRNHDHAAHAH